MKIYRFYRCQSAVRFSSCSLSIYVWMYVFIYLPPICRYVLCICGGSVYVASGIIMPGECCIACRFPHVKIQPQFQPQFQLQLPVLPAMSSCYQRSVPGGPTTRLRHATRIDFVVARLQTDREQDTKRKRGWVRLIQVRVTYIHHMLSSERMRIIRIFNLSKSKMC